MWIGTTKWHRGGFTCIKGKKLIFVYYLFNNYFIVISRRHFSKFSRYPLTRELTDYIVGTALHYSNFNEKASI